MKQNKVFIYGRHALAEALAHAPKVVTKVYLNRKAVDTKLRRHVDQLGIPVAELSEGLARSDMKSGAAHQGIIGSISLAALVRPYAEFIERIVPTKNTALVLLNGVQDPHNVGAIIRSAAGFGAGGVLMPQKEQAPVSGAVIKVSAGMAFRIPLVEVGGVVQTIADLKKRGFSIYGLAADGTTLPLPQARFDSPAVFVFGNEGIGIADDIRKLCDSVLSIPMDPRCESLNVAASAAVTLYQWGRGRGGQE
ncbi:23S rRNA (guanosine(2251)-2'-O)-methyltransferase RlmB [Candidatus Adlerbacteria bacterium RIFCSPHIGHO2_02_FULL_54_18]|uniref:23S rRNA (Guanosine(2251)-2'-O)-methyltransferase RlmB n=2 Tax=Candidatus Adleribacteriota TaxID=1752736 RepID=A0A1F4Y3T1_9BACT|nr:MAG: 23S rRNA (guanosine(2251)-2'-O)-methyltransferase RlmB [Candidatus Adlerbacteria bacterium RIFCSPLOWO2_01_FULL_54_21b]OGC87973.1 MAG: 23S rRNA (guanosine(2251)-2'-O)-methyltransferase RlmB [Candidatus Adlerbacteria bacterium RIFCSPHIGHO2_02_FULL_54_18]